MQSASLRAQVVVALRDRVAANVASRLNDREAVQVALASAMRDPEEVLGFMLPHYLARMAVQAREKLKLQPTEWNSLFGHGSTATRDGGISAVVQSKEFVPQLQKVSNAIRTTIGEREQAVVWDRSWTKVLCYIAMHLEAADEALIGIMGTIIKADNRRIEELHCSIDDDGPEVMLVARCIVALSECIV